MSNNNNNNSKATADSALTPLKTFDPTKIDYNTPRLNLGRVKNIRDVIAFAAVPGNKGKTAQTGKTIQIAVLHYPPDGKGPVKVGPPKFSTPAMRVLFTSLHDLGEKAISKDNKPVKEKYGITLCDARLVQEDLYESNKKRNIDIEEEVKTFLDNYEKIIAMCIEFKALNPDCHEKMYTSAAKEYDDGIENMDAEDREKYDLLTDEQKEKKRMKDIRKTLGSSKYFSRHLARRSEAAKKRLKLDNITTVKFTTDPFFKFDPSKPDAKKKPLDVDAIEIAKDEKHPKYKLAKYICDQYAQDWVFNRLKVTGKYVGKEFKLFDKLTTVNSTVVVDFKLALTYDMDNDGLLSLFESIIPIREEADTYNGSENLETDYADESVPAPLPAAPIIKKQKMNEEESESADQYT
jgi:hypothetical protein